MKLLKTIALGLFLATSSVGITSIAHAEDPGRITFAPKDAINNVIAKIGEAQAAIAADVDGKKIAKIIKKARDLNKEINANDKVDITRQRANSELRKARGLVRKASADDKAEKYQEAAHLLTEATKKYESLKGML